MPLSSRFVSKEKLGEFHAWQPAAFSNPRAMQADDASLANHARIQGFEEGRREGYAAGAQLAAAQGRQLAALLDAVGCEMRALGDRAANDALNLAIAIARQLTRRELTVHPEAILPLVSDAMSCLPRGTRAARLALHPEDVGLVNQHLGEELSRIDWRVVEDPSLRQGECRISADCGDVDATLTTRWSRVLAALGVVDAES